MIPNKNIKRLSEKYNLPEDFILLIKSKMYENNKLEFALQMFNEGLLGYDMVMQEKIIEVRALYEAVREKNEEQINKYKNSIILSSSKKYYSSEKSKGNLQLYGGYCVYVNDEKIIAIEYEEGGNRNGGYLYMNTEFKKYGENRFNDLINIIKDKFQSLYEEIKAYDFTY